MWSLIGSNLENVPYALEKNEIYYHWMECSIYLCKVQLVYSAIQVLYLLTGLLSHCSINESGAYKYPTIT